MKQFFKELPWIMTIAVLAWLIQLLTTRHLFAYVPAIITLPAVITWTIPFSWPYLIALAILGELLTGLPPGFITLSVIFPAFFYRFRRRIEADLSFSFLGLIFLTTCSQLLSIMSYDMWQIHQVHEISWRMFGILIGASTIVSFSSILLTNYLRPRVIQPIVSFDTYHKHARTHRHHY